MDTFVTVYILRLLVTKTSNKITNIGIGEIAQTTE